VTDSYGQSWYSLNKFIDTTVNWCPGDFEELFDANMADPKKRAVLEKFGWTKDNVSYTFNKHGFRADEFTDGVNDSVLFLGCSLTAGIGVDLESSWTYKVASSLGLRHYNLGVGGGGPDMCFRLAHHWIPRLRPKYVMMLMPMAGRMEILADKAIVHLLPNSLKHLERTGLREKIEPFYNGWLSHPANTDMHILKCSMGVQTICNSIGAPLIEIPVDKLELETLMGPEGWTGTIARDLLHPGKEWHQAVADKFLGVLQQK
jgi:hypothetical protein